MSDTVDKTNAFENAAIIMIVGGFVIYLLGVNSGFWWIYGGFLLISSISLVREIRNKNEFSFLRAIRIALPVIAIILTLMTIYAGGISVFAVLLILLLDNFFKRRAII